MAALAGDTTQDIAYYARSAIEENHVAADDNTQTGLGQRREAPIELLRQCPTLEAGRKRVALPEAGQQAFAFCCLPLRAISAALAIGIVTDYESAIIGTENRCGNSAVIAQYNTSGGERLGNATGQCQDRHQSQNH